MSNSAITFNTSGLASATSAGLVGTGAQTFAGKKTLDGGALIKGDTSGVAIASGYVGEKLRQYKGNNSSQNISATTWTNLNNEAGTAAVLTLGAGIWLITGTINLGGGVSQADNSKQFAISEYSGNTTTDHVQGTTFVYCTSPTAVQDGFGSLCFTVNNSVSKNYYAKLYLAVATSTAVLRFNFEAIRIA